MRQSTNYLRDCASKAFPSLPFSDLVIKEGSRGANQERKENGNAPKKIVTSGQALAAARTLRVPSTAVATISCVAVMIHGEATCRMYVHPDTTLRNTMLS
ncbi:hypothetical protein PRIPAC_75057 [Pristionchus pacificus]|uniref:Uncharacterized protein n=1 Tax=Pristionchus pacificus TaxID=54126 RepID=A0A2A6CFI9_PRIPA|nr:hypothetical protein PRIPAC_75057 [Pristionchus pacificus]|eukprot:PDM77005.1 hypothetical protein PRIPAC_42400 [Pristionchus pacificus]